MSKDIRIKKGLDLKLKGSAENTIVSATRSKVYAIKPFDFHGITPKMEVKEGNAVKAGDVIFYSKANPEIKFVSPVSGTVQGVVRGEKRVILEVRIAADSQDSAVEHSVKNPSDLSTEQIKEVLLASGTWPFIKQRPYDVVANPADSPKAIFVSGLNSAPLAADLNYVLVDKKEMLTTGFEVLKKLTSGKIHVTVAPNADFMPNVTGVEIHKGSGKHPVGLVSTQIAKIDPINKGERVWTLNIEDVAVIGELFKTGKVNFEKTVALTGTGFDKPSYVKVISGAQMQDVVAGNLKDGNFRIISGNVLTGDKKLKEDF